MLDIINQRILSELKKNSRIGWGHLADIVGISRQALKNRVDYLEYKKYIAGYTIISSFGEDKAQGVQSILKIKFIGKEGEKNNCFKLAKLLPSFSNVVCSWAVAGKWDMYILVKAETIEKISEVRELIFKTGSIEQIETEVIMHELHKM